MQRSGGRASAHYAVAFVGVAWAYRQKRKRSRPPPAPARSAPARNRSQLSVDNVIGSNGWKVERRSSGNRVGRTSSAVTSASPSSAAAAASTGSSDSSAGAEGCRTALRQKASQRERSAAWSHTERRFLSLRAFTERVTGRLREGACLTCSALPSTILATALQTNRSLHVSGFLRSALRLARGHSPHRAKQRATQSARCASAALLGSAAATAARARVARVASCHAVPSGPPRAVPSVPSRKNIAQPESCATGTSRAFCGMPVGSLE